MIIMIHYNKKDRLKIVLDIITRLKNYETSDGTIIDLYNEKLCSFITDFKNITKEYINQDDSKVIKEYSGKLNFVEINKTIEYVLPANQKRNSLFVIKMK